MFRVALNLRHNAPAAHHDHAIFEVEIPESWAGKTIGELDVRRRFGINILGVKRVGKTDVAVTSETVMPRGATILALGDYKALHKCFHI